MTLKITTILGEHPIAVGIAIVVAIIVFIDFWRHEPIDETLCAACRGNGCHDDGAKPCEVCRGAGKPLNTKG